MFKNYNIKRHTLKQYTGAYKFTRNTPVNRKTGFHNFNYLRVTIAVIGINLWDTLYIENNTDLSPCRCAAITRER